MSLKAQILKTLEDTSAGMTASELSAWLSVTPKTVSARLSELKSAGLIYPAGKAATVSGSLATVWITVTEQDRRNKRTQDTINEALSAISPAIPPRSKKRSGWLARIIGRFTRRPNGARYGIP